MAALDLLAGPLLARVFAGEDTGPQWRRQAFDTWWSLLRTPQERPMIDFTVETRIARPVHDVFIYATDPDRLSTWQTNTVSAQREDDGPYGVGSRLREVHRALGGKELEPLLGRTLRKRFTRQVATLKRLLEQAPVAA